MLKLNKKQWFFILLLSAILIFFYTTILSIKDINNSFDSIHNDITKPRVFDRNGKPLNLTYVNNWNFHYLISLEKVPLFFQKALIFSEDKRFYTHNGVDWYARLHALWQDISNMEIQRGASTITEQTVKILHERNRNFWSKWIEGFEANSLEKNHKKSEILEFYINQVPYYGNMRGIIQASNYYFNRDISLLNNKELLALVVLIKSPSILDIYTNKESVEKKISALAVKMNQGSIISHEELSDIKNTKLILEKQEINYNVMHFVNYILTNQNYNKEAKIISTLDLDIQNKSQEILDYYIKQLEQKKVNNIACIVINHETHEVLAWTVSSNKKSDTSDFDSILVERQPGSTLKPFLYAMAFENGWNAATIIDDSPLAQKVGSGLHEFNNYSNNYHGKITVRTALANSLNIPAIKTVDYFGVEKYLNLLHKLGFSLNKSSDYYGTGLALGNGEVSLLELARAYTVFPNRGKLFDLKFTIHNFISKPINVFKEETTSIITHILSDEVARSIEFENSTNFLFKTAFKTGTSNDYRDSWVVAYDSKYLVAVWAGNLNNQTTLGVTGSYVPLKIAEDTMNYLNRNNTINNLYISPKLIKKEICVEDGIIFNDRKCNSYTEFFETNISIPNELPDNTDFPFEFPKIIRPTNDLIIAVDPRVPLDEQKFKFDVQNTLESDIIEWKLDDKILLNSNKSYYLWKISRGDHILNVSIIRNGNIIFSEKIKFRVI
ncbi:MAG: transglycosylase domain-containing protein [Rickettsiales bacterium]|nr:transglycosylase domain-containing protein [Rickettsiales bacterium]